MKHPTLMSYSRIPQLPPSDFVPFAARIATWSDSVCCIRSHSQPHEKSHTASGHMESPSSVYLLFDVCLITHNACRLRLPRIWNPSFRVTLHALRLIRDQLDFSWNLVPVRYFRHSQVCPQRDMSDKNAK